MFMMGVHGDLPIHKGSIQYIWVEMRDLILNKNKKL